MAIELPSELTWTMRAFGFQWPDLHEDHFSEAASHLRQYAKDASASMDATHRRVRDLREVYESGSYEALMSTWGSQTQGHLQTLVQGCHYVADALEYATSRIINGLLNQLEQDVLGHLLDKVLGSAVEEIERTVAKLSYQEASGALLGPEATGGTKANTEHMRVHSAVIHREAEGVSVGGAQLVSKLAGLSFTSGG